MDYFEEKSHVKESRFFIEVFVRSWWVILFLIFCVIVYDQASIEIAKEHRKLVEWQQRLKKSQTLALLNQQELVLQINSRSDYNWIELTLIKGLGVVPKGYQKVYFQLPEHNLVK